MPQSSNVLSFVPVPNVELGQRRTSVPPPKPSGIIEDEAVLRKIAEAALSATGAEGAALALRREGAVVCVARAGEMAPPLGARLDDTSGMSGECLREGKGLRCDDTETDTRVDADACRDLGLRSLAVSPVIQTGKDGGNVIGILEVFSPHPSTFTDRHMEVLRQLAELVVADSTTEPEEVESPPVAKSPPETHATAIAPQPRLLQTKASEEAAVGAKVAPTPPPPAKVTRTAISSTQLPADVNISAYMAAHEKAQSQAQPRIPKVVLVGLAVIVFASLVGFYFRHWTPSATNTAASAPPAVPALNLASPSPAETSSIAVPDAKPPAETSSTSSTAKPEHDPLTNAASKDRIAGNSVNVTKPIRVVSSPTAAADVDVDAAPGLPAANGDAKPSNPVTALLNTPTALPTRAPPISQGVEGGDIESKVAAIYPPQARAVGQHGTVVLDVLVATDGSVKDVKVVSGPPLLRQAAIDAVRRWKYQPFKLNGQRISAQTQVQVDFKLQ